MAGSFVTDLTQRFLKAVLNRHARIRSVARVHEVSRQMLVVYAAAVLAVALIGARYLRSATAEDGGHFGAQYGVKGASGSTGAEQNSKFQPLVVYVSGAVRRPGVVSLRDGDRVVDAIKAAGGTKASAELSAVNLAARVADGQQVAVPSRGPGAAAAGASGAAGPISLSTATPEQLDQLDGIGPGLAQKIVDYRTQHGGFRSVDELSEVPGIGEKRLESLRAQLQP